MTATSSSAGSTQIMRYHYSPGQSEGTIVVCACFTPRIHWTFRSTNTPLLFRDTAATNSPQRFYRAVVP